MTVAEYLNLITSEHREKPDFKAVVTLNVAVPARVQELLKLMIPLFDVDVAVGDQLDIIGKWVGVTRDVAIPIAGIFFTWDGVFSNGWDYGTWTSAIVPTEITVLPDDAYRVLIKAKIAANQWDGTMEGAYAIWESLFSTLTILIVDNQDMSYDLGVVGGIVDSLTLALITGGYIPLKPEGVRVRGYFVSIDSGPVFSWDTDSTLLKGWDTGSWVREFAPT